MLALLLFLAPLIDAIAAHNHHHVSRSPLPGTWYHEDNHATHDLFRRDTFLEVGSDAWKAAYPTIPTIYSVQMPDAWSTALKTAVAAGKIPDIPVSTSTDGADPVYPAGTDPKSTTVCSSTYKCQQPDDIWNAPDGIFGVSFDDGPTDASPKLYDFLQKNQIKSTQFMIGVAIHDFPDGFKQAYNTLNLDIAVHTYTHPHLTTLTNDQILAEIGWTMQIIYDSTGGKVPKYMRPPTGDADNRVRAILKEVFGLTMILWNETTEDWRLTVGGQTPAAINASMTTWLQGPKSPGLIILEHELSDQSVQAFIDAYPVIKQNNWNMVSVTELGADKSAYRSGAILSSGDSGSTPNTNSTTTTSAGGSGSNPTTNTSGSNPTGTSTTKSTTTTGASAPGNSKGNGAVSDQLGFIPTLSSVSALVFALLL